MIAKDLINLMIPELKPEDSISKAHQLMDELRLSELPVVENGEFIGLINEGLLFDDSLAFAKVGEYPLIGADCFVVEANHYYEVLRVANEFGYKLVAVVDDMNIYRGTIPTQDVVEAFAGTSSVTIPGAILSLRLKSTDYSLSEISRIIEINQGKILSSYLGAHPQDPEDLLLTLKLNTEDVTYIRVSLEQNGFNVEGSFSSRDTSDEEKERIDMLMKYLKI